MEAALDLDLTADICCKFNGRVFIEIIVSDNNSTMRSLLKHKKLNNKSKLPIDGRFFSKDKGYDQAICLNDNKTQRSC